jgi:O-antigen ligase
VSVFPPPTSAWRAARLVEEHHGWLLIATTLLLFCTSTLFLAPLGLMALLGLWRSVRRPWQLRHDAGLRLLAALFLCLWMPQLVSLPDAINLRHSGLKTLGYPVYFLAGVFVLHALRAPRCLARVSIAVFAIATFWIADALLQYASGANLAGYPYKPGQLSGMFHPKVRLGHMLALLAPLYLETLRMLAQDGGRRLAWWLPALPLFAVLLLSGKRVAWLMALFGIAAYALYLLVTQHRHALRALAGAALVALTLFAVLVQTHEPLARRVQATFGLFGGDRIAVSRATAQRLPIWDTALRTARAHWFNGVGVRGFRHAYVEHAAPGNFFVRRGRSGQTHPHLAVLEIGAETGAVGLLGYLLFWLLLLRRAADCLRSAADAVPWYIAAAIAWLPFNAHLAFYGSYWSSVSWWILLLALGAERRVRDGPASCPS